MIMKMLNRIFTPSLNHGLSFDETGGVTGHYVRKKNNIWQKRDELQKPVKGAPACALIIPPGVCALRSLTLENSSKKDALQAIQCEAEITLLDDPEKGWEVIRGYSHKNSASGILVWCDRKYLAECRDRAEQVGFTAADIWIPELCLGQSEPVLLCHVTSGSAQVFYLSKSAPPFVQTAMASGLEVGTLVSAVLKQAKTRGADPLKDTFIWVNEGQVRREVTTKLRYLDLPNPPVMVQDWPDILPHMTPAGNKEAGFTGFLNSQDQRSAESRELYQLTGSVLVAIVAVAMFFFSYLIQAENDVKLLKKDAAQITRVSRKAANATAMVRDIQKKNRLIRTFTQDKPYLLAVLRDITEATSTESRLNSMSISHNGSIALQGLSKDEILITSIIKKMEVSPLINDCRLTRIEKDRESGLFRFSIEARSDHWDDFFLAENLK